MKCPLCDVELKMAERMGIEIDYCPQCRGIWLDRGELDKMLESSRAREAESYREEPRYAEERPPREDPRRYEAPPRHHEERREYAQPAYHHGQPGQHGHYGHQHGRKRKSFLEEIFDFD